MHRRLIKTPPRGWIPFITSSLVSLLCLCSMAIDLPLAFETPWLLNDEDCESTGDVPICEVAFTSDNMAATGRLRVTADQDSPLIGSVSRGGKHLQFTRTFSTESSITLSLLAELTGSLLIEGGNGEVVVHASVVLLDAATTLPIPGMEISASTSPGRFFSLSTLGTLNLQDETTHTATLRAGTYTIIGVIEVAVEMDVGWQNDEAEADVCLRVEILIGDEETNQSETTHDGPDYIVIPLGVEGTSYAHLEPGVRGGTFCAASLSEPQGWNAVTAHEEGTTRYTSIMMRGLVSMDPSTGELVPELAQSWDIAEDGLKIIFHLRHGLKWSDGEPFGAEDVLFTFNDLYFNPDVETDIRDRLRLPDGSFPIVEAIDEHTIRVCLSVPFRPILTALTSPIMPKHALANSVHKLNPDVPVGQFNETWTLDTDPEIIIGMGPFVLEGYYPGMNVTLRRNPHYYHIDSQGTQLPYLDQYVVLKGNDRAFEITNFQSHRLDAFQSRPGDVSALLKAAEDNGFTMHVDPETATVGSSWIAINQDYGLAEGTDENLRTLFRDLRFRKAVAHAIDKDTIIANVYSGMAVPQWSPVTMSSPYYAGRAEYGGPITEENAVIYGFDLGMTRSLLDEINIVDRNNDGWRDYEDGATVELELTTGTPLEDPSIRDLVRDSICTIITEDLRSAGLKATFRILDFNTVIERLHSSTLQLVLLGFNNCLEPHGEASVYGSTGEKHIWHLSAARDDIFETEQTIDGWLSAGAATFDQTLAFDAYKEYQIAYAQDDLGLIFTVNPSFFYAYYNDIGNAHVANPIANPSGLNGLTMDLIFRK
jgi:peptide/nickel transport system substrate-binding protein